MFCLLDRCSCNGLVSNSVLEMLVMSNRQLLWAQQVGSGDEDEPSCTPRPVLPSSLLSGRIQRALPAVLNVLETAILDWREPATPKTMGLLRKQIEDLGIGCIKLLVAIPKPDAIVLMVERTSATEMRLIVCNSGRGFSLYHPTSAEKQPLLKHSPCISFDRIHPDRISSPAFLALLLSPPEGVPFTEMLYESLLPWVTLAGPNGNLPLKLTPALSAISRNGGRKFRGPALHGDGICMLRCFWDVEEYLLVRQDAEITARDLKKFLLSMRR